MKNEDESYFSKAAINNSCLSYIDPMSGGSPRYFKKYLDGLLDSKDNDSFQLGTLIHKVLLEPDSIDITPSNVPGPKVKEIIDVLFNRVRERHEGLMPHIELKDIEEGEWGIVIPDDYYSNRTLSSRIDSILKTAEPYWIALCQSQDKHIVDSMTYHQIMGCVDSIRMHPFASELIEGDGFNGSYDEAHNEVEIYFTEKWDLELENESLSLDFKAKVDRILFNHEEKTYSIVDLKTTRSPIGMFQDTFEKYDYDRQLAFYQWAVSKAYPDYSPKSMYIVAVQTNKEYPCEIFSIDESYLDLGWSKASELISRIAYHTYTNNWGASKETLMTGAIPLKYEEDY